MYMQQFYFLLPIINKLVTKGLGAFLGAQKGQARFFSFHYIGRSHCKRCITIQSLLRPSLSNATSDECLRRETIITLQYSRQPDSISRNNTAIKSTRACATDMCMSELMTRRRHLLRQQIDGTSTLGFIVSNMTLHLVLSDNIYLKETDYICGDKRREKERHRYGNTI